MLKGYTLDTSRPFIMKKAEQYDGKIRWVPDYPTNILFGNFSFGDKIDFEFPLGIQIVVQKVYSPTVGYKVIKESSIPGLCHLGDIIEPNQIPVGTIAREYIPNIRIKRRVA